MSRTLSVEQISSLISKLPATKSGLKIDWRSSPKEVAQIVKALINSKEGIVTLVSKASGVHNQTLYAVMRGKTPDGGKEWPELREALSKMKCDWRGKEKETTSTSLLPVTSESLDQVFGKPAPVSKVSETKVAKPSKNRVKVKGEQVSKQEQKFYDFETKELDPDTYFAIEGIEIGKLSKVLDSMPKLDYVFAFNDIIALQAWDVAKQNGREKSIKFIGIDGLNDPNGGIQAVKDGKLTATILYPTGGSEAIKLLILFCLQIPIYPLLYWI